MPGIPVACCARRVILAETPGAGKGLGCHGKERLTAFSDGVIAVIITIMVLDLKAPRETTPAALLQLVPGLLGYALSFVYVGIYWNNHHHCFQRVERVDGALLWANLHLLFWLSLIPFATGWSGQHPLAAVLKRSAAHDQVVSMTLRALACVATLLASGLLGGCSSSFGGGGSAPARTYVVLPNGQTVPAETTTRPPGD